MITLKSWLGGEWREGAGEPRMLVNPATEAKLARTSTEGLDLRAAVWFARDEGGAALRAMTFAARASLLEAMSAALHDARDELLRLSIENGGNTRSDAEFDVDGATGALSAYARLGRELGERRILPEGEGVQLGRTPPWWGRHVLVPREGVAVLVNAFSFPAWGFAEKAACALLAGMPVIVKPATSTALVAHRMCEILDERDVLPPGAVQLLCGPAGDLLSHLREQDVVAFTGSAKTAASLRVHEDLVRRSVTLNVEADSLNAAVLGPDVDPEGETGRFFLRDVLREMTQKAGQKCTAVRRILVPAERLAAVRDELVAELRAVRVGDPARPEVRMGPLATEHQLAEARAGIEKLTPAGKVLTGGARPAELSGVETGRGYFLEPTLLGTDDPGRSGIVHRREVFGPVATLMPYSGRAADAAAIVRLGAGCLVSSAYSDDPEWLGEIVSRLASWNGRLYLGSRKVADTAFGSGAALPSLVHGGPGRAGGGEELGGLRGLALYQQRCAVQGDRGLLVRLFPAGGAAEG